MKASLCSGGQVYHIMGAARFHDLASNSQQFGVREFIASKVVNEVVATDHKRLENKITGLTSPVRQLAIGQQHISPLVRVYDICASIEHPTNACPILQEIELNSVGVIDIVGVNVVRVMKVAEVQPPLPSIVQPSIVQPLHPLVITANKLQPEQKERLLQVLRKHRKAIGWTLADLPGINPSICMHRILLEEKARPLRQP
ncbi:hypothetical protein CR513_22363, partial [Mucuna pruriens]